MNTTPCSTCKHYYKVFVKSSHIPHWASQCDKGVRKVQLNENPCPYYEHNTGLIRLKEVN